MEHNQNPLTLEQLRQMNGQPVWCVSFVSGRPAEWTIIRIVEACGDWFIASSGAAQAFGGKNTYGKDWLAYACKPIDFDKWEPCELCIRFGETDPCYKDMCFKINAPNCGYACGKFLKWKPAQARLQDSKFCPECGRPLTQDARVLLEKRIMEG